MFCMAKQFMTTLLSIHEARCASIHEAPWLQFVFFMNCNREPFRSRVHELTALPSWIALRGKALKDSGCPCWDHCSIPKRFCKYDTLPKFGAWSLSNLCRVYKKWPLFGVAKKIRNFLCKKISLPLEGKVADLVWRMRCSITIFCHLIRLVPRHLPLKGKAQKNSPLVSQGRAIYSFILY